MVFIPSLLHAQVESNTYTDLRDGKIYHTVKINNTIWFKDNLKYETQSSFCPHQVKKKSKCKQGNYYSRENLDEVCPKEWEIPSELDWLEYYKYRLKEKRGNVNSIFVDSLDEEYISLVYMDSLNLVKLFEQSNPLGLNKLGWVEGKRIRKWGTTTYWIRHSEIEDNRFHIHLGKGYVVHRHKHHIEDSIDKRRKFLIKCVKRVE